MTRNVKKLVRSWVTKHAKARVTMCVTCNNAEVAAAVREFAALKKDGGTQASWAQFHQKVLIEGLGWQYQYVTMMKHVRQCLGINGRMK